MANSSHRGTVTNSGCRSSAAFTASGRLPRFAGFVWRERLSPAEYSIGPAHLATRQRGRPVKGGNMGRFTRLRAQSESASAHSLSRRAFLGAMAGIAGLMCGPKWLHAAGPSQADGSEQARYAAEQAIPFDQLKP